MVRGAGARESGAQLTLPSPQGTRFLPFAEIIDGAAGFL
jgi:hypothetical protein